MKSEWKARVLESSAHLFDEIVDNAETVAGKAERYASPIENAFAVAVNILISMRYPEFVFDEDFGKTGPLLDEQLDCTFPRRPIWGVVAPQVVIGDYRVDFAIRYVFGLEGAAGVVVECDGHAFHEKTKEQVARDKSRDRDLQTAGFHVLRFSGSEIWKDPISCADQALYLAHGRALESAGARASRDRGDLASMHLHLKWMVQ